MAPAAAPAVTAIVVISQARAPGDITAWPRAATAPWPGAEGPAGGGAPGATLVAVSAATAATQRPGRRHPVQNRQSDEDGERNQPEADGQGAAPAGGRRQFAGPGHQRGRGIWIACVVSCHGTEH
jgi:hypothetical protein